MELELDAVEPHAQMLATDRDHCVVHVERRRAHRLRQLHFCRSLSRSISHDNTLELGDLARPLASEFLRL